MITTNEFNKLWETKEKEYTHMVYNVESGITAIAHSEENANKIAEYMSKYHGQEFAVRENLYA